MRPAQPASRAMRSHKRLVGVPDAPPRRPAPRGNPGSTSSAGHACDARRAREVRAQPQPFREDLLHVLRPASGRRRRYPDPRDHRRRPSTSPRPRSKEWAAIVHALLEGEQIVDVRKGGLREDGRHFDVAAPALLALPRPPSTRSAELLKPAYRHWIDLATASPVGEPITVAGLGRRHRRRDDHRARAPRRARLEARSGPTTTPRPGSSGRSAIRCGCSCCACTASTSRSPSRGTRRYGGCTSWVDLDGLPADPGDRCRRTPRSPTSRSRPSARASARRSPPSAGSE